MQEVGIGPTQTLRTRVVQSLEELETYAQQWDNLLLRCAVSVPMQSYAWVSACLKHRLPAHRPWCCLMAFEGERLVGVLPLEVVVNDHPTWRGVRLQSLTDTHLCHVDAVIEAGREEEVVLLFMQVTNRHFPGWWHLAMRGIPSGSPLLRTAQQGIECTLMISRPHDFGSYIAMVTDFQSFVTSLSSNFRRGLAKSRKRLERRGAVKLEVLAGPVTAENELARFLKVEASGWKGRRGSAIRESDSLIAFYTTLSQRLARSGLLEWHFLTLNGETIAGHMAMRVGRRMTLWKIGYDETYADCSPGNLLLLDVVRNALERKEIDSIDLVTDQPWHLKWTTAKVAYFDVWFYRQSPIPVLFDAVPKYLGNYLRRLARYVRGTANS